MYDLTTWLERGAAALVIALLWLRTSNVHARLARIERALAPGVKHEVRRG
jgi:hypothetical protein